jgi:hypothetical protein
MVKKLLLALAITFILAPVTLAANHDFSKMNPTVKVTSYKMLYTGQVVAYGSGSGSVITPDGIILTNHHVIFSDETFKPLDAFEVCITFDGTEDPVCDYTAHLITHDKDLDVALLKLDPNDVFGQPVPGLKSIDWQSAPAPQTGDKVRVVGYPASGGESITSSQGQISGFETQNGYRYFKTDTDFDHGSSGGTAYDANGRFIGIPTYIRSYAENVGYFLDLNEARPWIQGNIGKTPEDNSKANVPLIRELARLSKANETLSYTQDRYPFLSLTLPNDWKFLEINDDSLFAGQKNASDPVELNLILNPYQYKVDDAYLKRLDEELQKTKTSYPDYKKEAVTLAGQKAWKTSFTSDNLQNITYYVPYGYAVPSFSYAINLDEATDQEKSIQPVLDSIHFTQPPQDDPNLSPTLQFVTPPFSITMPDGWRIQKNMGTDSQDLLAEAVQNGNFDGSLTLSYAPIPKDELDLSDADRLKAKTKTMGNNRLVFKNDKVVLGGLPGFLYAYEYEGEKYQELKKHLILEVRDGDNEFTLEYDDLSEHFDANLPPLRQMLDSFAFNGKTTLDKALHDYGTLGLTFNDIQYHPYAQAISDLADKGLVTGDQDGNFDPEASMGRGEALKLILDSRNHLENDKKSGKAVDFTTPDNAKTPFRDIRPTNPLAPYIRYAFDKKMLQGFGDKTFRPTMAITLAETLKLLLGTFEIPIWKGDTTPWTKKYMDKGFELDLIPYGMWNPDQALTRAEVAYLVSQIYKNADNQMSFNY